MSMPILTPSIRIRRTPFSSRVEAAGPKAYTVYNHMLLASWFQSTEEDCAHLRRAVQVWDVACERQVEIVGPDARKLVQMSTPRDLSSMKDDQCYYIPTVDEHGGMTNDPVLVKLAADRYWVSLADSDMVLYYKGLARGHGLDVEVFEPDVSPLAIQGPRANDLIARVFGEEIVQTRFFRHKTINVEGRDMIIARSGWSLQGGFEIYVDGTEYGEPLWDRLMDAGKEFDVRVGCPNNIDRIEGGLLSYGSDMTREHTPFEAGLGKYCNLETATSCIGHEALVEKQDPERQIRPVEVEGEALPAISSYWPLRAEDETHAGHISSITWSPGFQRNIAIAMIEKAYWFGGAPLIAETPVGEREVTVLDKFWI